MDAQRHTPCSGSKVDVSVVATGDRVHQKRSCYPKSITQSARRNHLRIGVFDSIDHMLAFDDDVTSGVPKTLYALIKVCLIAIITINGLRFVH